MVSTPGGLLVIIHDLLPGSFPGNQIIYGFLWQLVEIWPLIHYNWYFLSINWALGYPQPDYING
ncbi:hypothetical protein [Spirosoma terrae]|uniref:Uncharacterized protein n=1 Tax=Spirosoma terrae TaxID=1968276 RepID=A0A6L9LGK0_9BACT|nr:hypothetical protein [Spirosoma terrae]NDU95769.1 hypothetical protein [Spirosoma terrae]